MNEKMVLYFPLAPIAQDQYITPMNDANNNIILFEIGKLYVAIADN